MSFIFSCPIPPLFGSLFRSHLCVLCLLSSSILSMSNLLVIWNTSPSELDFPSRGRGQLIDNAVDLYAREENALHTALLKGLLAIPTDGWKALYPNRERAHPKSKPRGLAYSLIFFILMIFFECRLCVQSGAKVNVKTLHCTPKTTLSDVLRWQQGEAGGIIFLFYSNYRNSANCGVSLTSLLFNSCAGTGQGPCQTEDINVIFACSINRCHKKVQVSWVGRRMRGGGALTLTDDVFYLGRTFTIYV